MNDYDFLTRIRPWSLDYRSMCIGVVLGVLLASLFLAGAAQAATYNPDQCAADWTVMSLNDLAAYLVLTEAGLPVCAIALTPDICSNPCECANFAFSILEQENPTFDLVEFRANFFAKFGTELGCVGV